MSKRKNDVVETVKRQCQETFDDSIVRHYEDSMDAWYGKYACILAPISSKQKKSVIEEKKITYEPETVVDNEEATLADYCTQIE